MKNLTTETSIVFEALNQTYSHNFLKNILLTEYDFMAKNNILRSGFTPRNFTVKERYAVFNYYNCNYISDRRFINGLAYFLKLVLNTLYNLLIIIMFIYMYNILSSGFGLSAILINFRPEVAEIIEMVEIIDKKDTKDIKDDENRSKTHID